MNPRTVDYYAVLQVHADAEQEVINAAYRQLMRMYHPDVAGADPEQIARSQERAKAINQAYAVLRDPAQRRIYDSMRRSSFVRSGGTQPHSPPRREATARATAWQPGPSSASAWQSGPASESAWRTRPMPDWRTTVASVAAEVPSERVAVGAPSVWWHIGSAPFVAIWSAFYLLPGAYEWERGGQRELVQALSVPIIGVASWAMLTGRLDAVIGQSFGASIGAWLVLGVVALLLVGAALPRLLLSGGGALLLTTGALGPSLQSAGVPVWVAWGGLSALSMLLAARLYVFGVLPTIGICWLLARVG